tara:strand:+ start:1763 stop:2803 length:1041 start_codon:yes stop_codon:yes gene_type:complete
MAFKNIATWAVTDRLLPERARIEFHYPNEKNTIAFVPFYENPQIKESQAANYAEYNPIGRGGSLYAYTGSQSRKFKVRATYTLPHLAQHPMGIQRFLRTAFGNSKKEQQLLFANINKGLGHPGDPAPESSYSQSYGAKDRWTTLLKESLGIVDAPPVPAAPQFAKTPNHGRMSNSQGLGDFGDDLLGTNVFDELVAEEGVNDLADLSVNKGIVPDQIIDTLLFFVVLFRTSVVNNAANPVLGPPILRLTHGTMYQSVPCVCKSYNLEWEEEGGFDLETLTPRRLVIDLQLEEMRTGDFQTFDVQRIVQRNNLTGWESAIASPYTIDPTDQAFVGGMGGNADISNLR